MVPADFMWLDYGTLVEDYVRLCEGGADGVYTFNCCCETIGNPSFVEAIHAVAHDQDSLQTGVEWPRNLRRSGHRPTQDQHPCRRRYALRGNAYPTARRLDGHTADHRLSPEGLGVQRPVIDGMLHPLKR